MKRSLLHVEVQSLLHVEVQSLLHVEVQSVDDDVSIQCPVHETGKDIGCWPGGTCVARLTTLGSRPASRAQCRPKLDAAQPAPSSSSHSPNRPVSTDLHMRCNSTMWFRF